MSLLPKLRPPLRNLDFLHYRPQGMHAYSNLSEQYMTDDDDELLLNVIARY